MIQRIDERLATRTLISQFIIRSYAFSVANLFSFIVG